MKKYLISTLGMLVATFMFVSQSFSVTTIKVEFDLNMPFNDATHVEIPTGSCIMFIKASAQTALDGIPSAPVVGNPFFLSNGDTLLTTYDSVLYPSIQPYFSFTDFGVTPFPYETFVETAGMTPGTTFKVYLRIFDNISGMPYNSSDVDSPYNPSNGYDFIPPSSFDASGNYNGNTLLSGKNAVSYMDSQLFTLTVPDPLAAPSSAPIVFTINPDTFNPLITSEPVPEPGMMLLMAGGLCWIFGRLRRK